MPRLRPAVDRFGTGCEWEVVEALAKNDPSLLSRVDQAFAHSQSQIVDNDQPRLPHRSPLVHRLMTAGTAATGATRLAPVRRQLQSGAAAHHVRQPPDGHPRLCDRKAHAQPVEPRPQPYLSRRASAAATRARAPREPLRLGQLGTRAPAPQENLDSPYLYLKWLLHAKHYIFTKNAGRVVHAFVGQVWSSVFEHAER